MTAIKKIFPKKDEDNEVLDTAGGEMPDANRKPKEKASEAAEVFKKKDAGKNNVRDIRKKAS
jgi:hypothetical protein